MRFDRVSTAAPRAAIALLFAAAAGLAGCSSSPPLKPVTTPISHIVITSPADTLQVGGQFQFTAVAFDTSGAPTGKVSIGWSSSDPVVCTISSGGLATAVGEGTARIIARAGGKSDSALVYVKSAFTGWYTQTSGTARNLTAVCFLPDGRTGFAVGDVGTMVTTTNSGATWTPTASGTGTDLTSIWFSDAATGWAVGKAGTLMRSGNGGATWTQQVNLAASVNLECVRFVDGQHGWIAGDGGLVARTRDGGATWTTHVLTAQPLFGVSFSDSLNGWVVGAGVIFGTHDGGTSWYPIQPSITALTLRAVARTGGNDAWAVGAQGTIASTSATADSLAWALDTGAGANYQLNAIHMTSATTGWIAGSNIAAGAILATVDGGVTWTAQAASASQALNGIYFADGLRGWAVGAAGRIVHTATAGNP